MIEKSIVLSIYSTGSRACCCICIHADHVRWWRRKNAFNRTSPLFKTTYKVYGTKRFLSSIKRLFYIFLRRNATP